MKENQAEKVEEVIDELDGEVAEPEVDTEQSETEEVEESGNGQVQSEEETDVEFDDGKPKQSPEQNAEFARKRREAERQKAIQEAYERGKKEALTVKEKAALESLIGAENHFTGEEITDENEARIYQTMIAMKKAGKDPTDPKAVITWQLAQKKSEVEKQTAEQKSKEWFDKDRIDFEEKYPDINLKKLIEDDSFIIFSEGKVGVQSLAKIYSDYVKFISKFEVTAEQKAESKLQRQQAYSKSSVKINSTSTEPAYYSMEQIKKMSREEISKNYDKVMKSYEHHLQK
jgi:hypothetical protein